MTRESRLRRAKRRRHQKLCGQSYQMQDPGQLCTHRAKERWYAVERQRGTSTSDLIVRQD